MRRVLLALAALALLPAGAAAKESVTARLTAGPDVRAAPGTTTRVEWTLASADGPFGASGVFVRLLGREGGATTATGTQTRSAGSFSASVAVPRGGIGGIRIGLHGRNDRGPADLFFPVVNDPFLSPAGVRCDAAAVARALRTFAGAFSRGDLSRLDALFARGDRFAWFSSGPPGARFSPAAGNRSTLVQYFAARHRAHDRIRILSYRFNSYDRGRTIGHFELTAARRAGDYRRGREFELVGKGAVDCSSAPVRFMVLSLGGPQ